MVLAEVAKGVKGFYTDILSQAFSPCGKYLAVTTVYSEVFVFDLNAALNPPDEDATSAQKPILSFSLDKICGAFSLLTTDKFLIVGSRNKIFGYDWKSIIAGKTPKVAWCWEIPTDRQNIDGIEVNSLVLSPNGSVYAGCGDNKIHNFSLEDGRHTKTLTGHEGYIHDLKIIDENKLVSASEDGTVKFWDLRKGKMTSQVEPWKESHLERPALGKWVGAVHTDKEWLVCGGGVRAGLWNIPLRQLMTSFETEDTGIHACMLHEERVIVGDRHKISQFTLLGDPIGTIASSAPTQLSFVYHESPSALLSIAGNSPHIDLCTNFDYRDQILTVC